jgi:acetate---CoA ligase (ADP-forming)
VATVDPAPLISPRSVALVGASDRPGSYADIILRNLEAWGFEGPVWGVNPNRERVHGRECVPSVADLPEPVDAVVIAIPAAGVPEAVAAAGTRGCGGAIVISAGFAEIEAGAGLQRELREAALAHDLPLCGPNGNGVLALHHRAALWGDSVNPLQPGAVAMVSQSGNVAVNALGSRRGIDFHTVVSTGNQAVLDASDWLDALAEAEGVRSVALFLESDGDGARFAEALAHCAEREVGVAVLKVGSSAAGTRAAAAHTGSVAGDHRVFRALVEEAGAAWARDLHELLELAKVLAEPRSRPTAPGGLAILTCSGGDSALAADEADRMGIPLPALGDKTRAALREMLPDAATIGNPLDYTAIIWGDSELLAELMRVVGADPGVAQLLMIYDHPEGLFGPGLESWAGVRSGIIEGSERTDAAVIVSSTLPDLIDETATAELSAREVPVVAGLREALSGARALRNPPGDAARIREVARAAAAVAGAGDGEWISESEAKEMLRDAGVPVPDGKLVADEDGAVALWRRIGAPVAVKLSAPGLLHKSEGGDLVLSLDDEAAIREAYRRLRERNGHPGAGVLVERMAEGGGAELLIAARSDGVVPSLVVGLGGIWTEALGDVVVIPLPADTARVKGALLSLRGVAAIAGGRGREPLDLDAAAEVAVAAGALLLENGLALVELNPVILGRSGAVAVDALISGGSANAA